MKNNLIAVTLLGLLSCLASQLTTAQAQTTAFTYQGRLNNGASPATGSYDLTFVLYNAASSGTPQGNALTNTATTVSNGLFTVTLDFGNQFPGADRWLEIGVRTNGGSAFAPLSPRQKITATPYAMTAGNVISGGLAAGTYASALTLNNPANQVSGSFTGNGVNVSNVNAATLGGVSSAGYWRTNGNAGAAGAFIGTTNNQPLEFKVNGSRVLRLEPNPTSPNLVGGFAGNIVSNGYRGAVIGGGGEPGYTNRVGGHYATVVGGSGNTAAAFYATAMGFGNTADGWYSTAMGYLSTASGTYSTAMGSSTTASGNNSTAMGTSTMAIGYGSMVMGVFSVANGNYATAIGDHNSANGEYSVSMGRYAQAYHSNTFVWSDGSTPTFSSTGMNQFLIQATGGVAIGTNDPAGAALRVAGTVKATDLDVNGTVTASNFSGSGAGLTNLNTWRLNGNAGTTPGTHFLGTTDDQPLEFKVNGQRALRFIPSTSYTAGTGPNLVAGGPGNTLAGSIGGAAVSGGWGHFIDLGADGAVIAGGASNRIGNNSKFSVISGGHQNELGLGSLYSMIAGGRMNRMGVGVYDAVIAGGAENTITTSYGQLTIGGGYRNSITGAVAVATISGGRDNLIGGNGFGAAIPGGSENYAGGLNSMAAGYRSRATGDYSFAMGTNALASGLASTAMGLSTIASGNYSTGLGWFTTASGEGSTTMGLATVASEYFSTAMGLETKASGWTSTAMGGYTVANGGFSIAMGYSNNASGHASTAMGSHTTASGSYSTAMGSQTTASGLASTAMGVNSRATNEYAFARGINTLAGGWASTAMGRNATASGSASTAIGEFATASGDNSTVLGLSTTASGNRSTAMGWNTLASGEYSTAMGRQTTASGNHSTAMGNASIATHDNTFVWSDGTTVFGSSASNQFLINATGGVGIGTGNPQAPLHLFSGNAVTTLRLQSSASPGYGRIEFVSDPQGSPSEWRPGYIQSTDNGGFTGGLSFHVNGTGFDNRFGDIEVMRVVNGRVGIGTATPSSALQVVGTVTATAFNPLSDRNLKENFKAVSPLEVLAKVAALPISEWNFIGDAATPHVGPMAQDFHAAFGLGNDERHIATVDADGVALAAIQGLNQKLEATRAENAELRQELAVIKSLLNQLTTTKK